MRDMANAENKLSISTPNVFTSGEVNCDNCEHVENSLRRASEWLPTAVGKASIEVVCEPAGEEPCVKLTTKASHNQLSRNSLEYPKIVACPVVTKNLEIIL